VASKSDEAIRMAAIALTDIHTTLAATLMTLGKQVQGRTDEARAELLKALDMNEKAAENLEALLQVAQQLGDDDDNG
jgi:hypothetical protein